ncbi:MAG: glycosyltransferase family 39 protein [Planctomycetota bacterium]|nr:glycosyltransferase family 39 protein [Planctomycetota bacterium]
MWYHFAFVAISVAMFGMTVGAVLVYLLACRWYGRRVAVLAGVLWATVLHMGHLSYLATTDMLVTFWITLSIYSADRLSFHRTPGQRDLPWVIALWGSMILAGMTKGWGLLNLALVGGMFAAAAATGPGFGVLQAVPGIRGKVLLLVRLIARRWRRLGRRLHLMAGMLVFAAAMAALLGVMFLRARTDFEEKLGFEILGRIFGGEDAPRKGTAFPPLTLLLCGVPASWFMVIALAQVRPRRWFRRRQATWLPLCWIASVVVPFSFTHGFRPDYLLPCYAAVAMLGAWGIERLASVAPQARRAGLSAVRHLAAAAPVILGISLIFVGFVYVCHDSIVDACRREVQSGGPWAWLGRPVASLLTKAMTLPPMATPETWWGMRFVPIVGAGILVLSVKASRRWDIRRLAALAVVGALALLFVDQNFFSSLARGGDGEKAKAFARVVRERIGDDRFAVGHQMNILATECYLGRFGTRVWSLQAIRALPGSDIRWLITTDKALLRLAGRGGRGPAAASNPQMVSSSLAQIIDSVGVCAYRYPDRLVDERLRGAEMLLIRIGGAGK